MASKPKPEDIYTKPLKPRGDINSSMFNFLFTEIIHYLMEEEGGDLEQALKDFARPMGH
jgi:hypothetical protein